MALKLQGPLTEQCLTMAVKTPQHYQSLPGLAPDQATQINTEYFRGDLPDGKQVSPGEGGESGSGWGNISTVLRK